jgi:transcriptional regulator with XRE-family HTH domain
MDICKRLRQLRDARGLSQGDIEERTGLLRCYVSRVECGHTVPQLDTLEKWADALGVSLSEVFSEHQVPPARASSINPMRILTYEDRLLKLVELLNTKDRKLLFSVASELMKQSRKTSSK